MACNIEYNGSMHYKYIQLLVSTGKARLEFLNKGIGFQRKACQHFDKKTSDLIRLEDEAVETDSPHIVAVCVDK